MNTANPFLPSVGQCASLACLWEATAGKPGNVHRGADFDELSYVDFATSAVVIGPLLERAESSRLGPLVLECVRATRQSVATNTNLGTILLVVPLAMVPRRKPLKDGIGHVLATLNADDARLVYEAIRLAQPGGLGKVDEADIAGEPPADLIAAMRLAADRDLAARQYANDFSEVFEHVVPSIAAGLAKSWPLNDVIVHTQLALMSHFPDSLIARKAGQPTAEQAAVMAAATLAAGLPGDTSYHEALADFDFWLRADGHRRNPGTTADLLAAGLFAALRDGIIQLPVRFY